jgi:hypothetical protein
MIVTLSNGKRVANFSSPHDFIYEDGTILPAQNEWLSEHLKVTFNEYELTDGDVMLSFSLSPQIKAEMQRYYDMWNNDEVDVVVCPLPMITAIREHPDYGSGYLIGSPFRSIRVEDRIKKLVSIHKQCL